MGTTTVGALVAAWTISPVLLVAGNTIDTALELFDLFTQFAHLLHEVADHFILWRGGRSAVPGTRTAATTVNARAIGHSTGARACAVIITVRGIGSAASFAFALAAGGLGTTIRFAARFFTTGFRAGTIGLTARFGTTIGFRAAVWFRAAVGFATVGVRTRSGIAAFWFAAICAGTGTLPIATFGARAGTLTIATFAFTPFGSGTVAIGTFAVVGFSKDG